MDEVVQGLEQGLKKQKYDLSKNTGLAKLIKSYREAKEELDALTESGEVNVKDTNKVIKAGERVSSLFKQINRSFKEIQGGDNQVLKNLFPENFSGKIDKGIREIDRYFQKLKEKGTKETQVANFTDDLVRLNNQLSALQDRRIKAEVEIDISEANKKLEELEKKKEELRASFAKRLVPEEPKDSKGKTQTEQLQANVLSKEKSHARAETRVKNLKKRELTKEEKADIENLKESYEGSDFKRRENAAKATHKKYLEEARNRDVASEINTVDSGRERRKLGRLSDEELAQKIQDSKEEIRALEKERDNYKKQIAEIEARPDIEYKEEQKKAKTAQKAAKTKLDNAREELNEHLKLQETQKEIVRQKADTFISGGQVSEATEEEIRQLKEYSQQIEETTNELKELRQEKTFNTKEEKENKVGAKTSEIKAKELSIQKIRDSIAEIDKNTTVAGLFTKLEELNIPTDDIEKSEEGIRKLRGELSSLDSKTADSIRQELIKMGVSAEDAEEAINSLTKGLDKIDLEKEDIKNATQEIENLKNQVISFFSIGNTIELFKRSVQSAFNTVKELDAVMTETATVTDFTVGDMWEKLPQYTDEASKLGASIKDVYRATTLYYQQGLKTNEAMAVGVETMKMARIANMDATDATQAMTAALRGFNMEINKTSAQHVNDVYSELAAITAADTSQIAAAMSKTASIASSANMEFETTAALLSQIIETTQEAPETAGTAMKTIIARFTEVKELFGEGMLTGEDEEGEAIDINKIDAALKTVGISLKDFLNGTKGIDDIFLELASKWDTLDLATQRYIATTAAGSRQQSRFIAMMSNYDRTMELVSAANNSAGASQKQYEKTLESMDAKLQQLKNAWDEFVMGLANNEVIKFGVDLLTGILTVVNKLTSALSGDNGLVKSFISLVTVVGALKGGGAIVKGIGNKFVQFLTSEPSKDNKKNVAHEEEVKEETQQSKAEEVVKKTVKEATEEVTQVTPKDLQKAEHNGEQKGLAIGEGVKKGVEDSGAKEAIDELASPDLKKTIESKDVQKEVSSSADVSMNEIQEKSMEQRRLELENEKYRLNMRDLDLSHDSASLKLKAIHSEDQTEIESLEVKIADIEAKREQNRQRIAELENELTKLKAQSDENSLPISESPEKKVDTQKNIPSQQKEKEEKKKEKKEEKKQRKPENKEKKQEKKEDKKPIKKDESSKEVIEDLDALSESQQKVTQTTDQSAKATENFAQKTQKAGTEANKTGNSVAQTNGKLEENADAAEKSARNWAIFSGACMAAGSALSMLGQLGEEQDWPEFLTDALQGAGTALTGFGGIASSLMMLFPQLASKVQISAQGMAIAGTTVKLAWWEIIVIIMAVVAVIGLLVAAFKEAERSTPEAKLKAAEEAANKAAEAADAAAESYQKLADSFDDLGDKYKVLDNLTVGTQAWRDQIQEINDMILGLIELYPELASLITIGEGGVFEIDLQGNEAQEILRKEHERKIRAQTAMIEANRIKQGASRTVDYKELGDRAKVGEWVDKTGIDEYGQEFVYQEYLISQEKTEELAKALSGNTEDSLALLEDIAKSQDGGVAAVQAWANKNNLTWNGTKEDIIALKEYGQGFQVHEKANEAAYSMVAQQAVGLSGLTGQAAEQSMNLLISGKMEDYISEQKKRISNLDEAAWKEEKKEYAKIKGYKYDEEADTFTDANGQKIEGITDSQIKAEYVTVKAMEQAAEAVEIFANGLARVNKEDTLGKYFSATDGSAFTKANLTTINKKGIDKYAEEEYEKLKNIYGDKDSDNDGTIDIEEIFGTQTEFIEQYGKAVNNASLSFDKVDETLDYFKDLMITNSVGVPESSKFTFSNTQFDQLSLQMQQAITSNLQRVRGVSGLEAELLGDINKAVYGESGGQDNLNKTEQIALWEALATVDWSNVDSIEGLSEVVQNLGITSPEAIKRIEELEGAIIKASKATKNWTSDLLDQELKPVEDLIDNLKGRDPDNRTFNKEQKDLILEASPELKDLFVKTGVDEFTFIGEDMDKLTNALEDLRLAILEQASQDIEQRAETSQMWKEVMSSDATITANAIGSKEEKQINISQAIQDLVTGDDLYGTSVFYGEEDLKDIFSLLGLTSTGDIQKDIELLKEQYGTYYGVGGGVAEQNIAAAGELGTEVEQQKLTSMSGQEILSSDSEEAVQTQALDALISKGEGLSIMAQNTEKSLNKLFGTSKDNSKWAKAMIADWNKQQKAQEKFGDTFRENEKDLESAKGSEAYATALRKVTEAGQELFGEDLTTDFVEDNIGLFKQLSKGGKQAEEAYVAINKKLIETKATNDAALQGVLDKFGGIDDLMSKISDKDFSIDGTADVSDIVAKMAEAGYAAKDAAALIGQLSNATVTFTAGGQWVDITDEELVKAYKAAGYKVSDSRRGQYYQVYLPRVSAKKNSPSYTGGGGGGGSGGGSDKWENPYDKLHNVLKDIDNELKKRDRLERNYQRVLESLDASANELIKISQDEIASLNRQKQRELERQNARSGQIENYYNSDANAKYREYVYYERDEDGYYTIKIDYDKMAQVEDADLGAGIEEFYDKMSEWAEDYNESKDSVEEIEDSVKEIEERGKDQYLSFEDTVKEALVESYQKEIDELQAINDSINDTNASLVNAIQDSITKQRQERENQKTEEDLEKKQRRLLYLQQDTSGANDLEILQLQREIEEGQQDYTDTLIDQKISELQEQNDKAAEQRERQISLLESQLEWYQLSGEIWKEVDELIKDGVDPDKGLKSDSRLAQILKLTDNYSGLSEIGKQEWWKEYNSMIAEALAWLMKDHQQLEQIGVTSGQIQFTTADGKTLTGRVDQEGNVTVDEGHGFYRKYSGVYRDLSGNYRTQERQKKRDFGTDAEGNRYTVSQLEDIIWNGEPITGKEPQVRAVQLALKGLGFFSDKIDGIYGPATARAMANFQKAQGTIQNGSLDTETKRHFSLLGYETGGLADFTGPAWLDGTKARPELVLNARDTENFIQLKDILSSILNGTSNTSTENNGDISYDIDINVESIGSDYDVEQIANKVKTMIGEDARYRNNNMVNVSR